MKYNLKFISDEDLYNQVKNTINDYRYSITFSEFTKNILDPIKMTFDANIYGKSIEEVIENEIIRQIDKSNTNHIGYFHQNIFMYIGGGDWVVPEKGFDIVNEPKKIYVEMKNKHNTMNSSSSQKTYMRMQSKIIKDDKATCMLVEAIATKSQDIDWKVSLDGVSTSHPKIRRVSIDKFYEIVTGDRLAFKKLCEILPTVIKDVVDDLDIELLDNDIFQTFQNISPNLLKSLYLLSFKTYEGFDDFNI